MTRPTNERSPQSGTAAALVRHLTPVNKVAARVTAPARPWVPTKRVLTQDSVLPIPYSVIPAESPIRAGLKRGYLTVLGRADGLATQKGAPYVCRCLCGHYTVRRAKALRNTANDKDACAICLHKQFLARRREFLTFGRNLL